MDHEDLIGLIDDIVASNDLESLDRISAYVAARRNACACRLEGDVEKALSFETDAEAIVENGPRGKLF